MLIKEYRFPLPLTLSEFELAQHYTILVGELIDSLFYIVL